MLAGRSMLPIAAALFVVGTVLISTAPVRAAEAEPLDLNQPLPSSVPSNAGTKSTGEVAKEAQNPVADLTIIPFQFSWDTGIGPDEDKNAYTLSIQPVVPISLNENWRLITREIIPAAYQEGFTDEVDDNWGLGDSAAEFFFSPKKPWHGWIWGAGPMFLFPTATDPALGGGKWGLGPTAVVLQQKGPWTIGALASHTWSVAGDPDRPYVSITLLQPFLAYSTQNGFIAYIETETTYDWRNQQWLVPIEPTIAQILPIGGQYIDIEFGPTFYVEGPSGGPDWGLRFNVALLFPH